MKAVRIRAILILFVAGMMTLPSCKKDDDPGDTASFSLDCSNSTHNGILFEGLAASGVTSEIPYSDGDGDTHNGQTVASTGLTGLTASVAAGTFADGSSTLTYTISGTPSASGTAYFALNIGGDTCTISRIVEEVPAIGDTHQGGIVFYLDGNGGGLIAAPSDQSTGAEWGCFGTTIEGLNWASVGKGFENTMDIVAGCSEPGIAARICNDLTLNGYSDWFLPSKGELQLVYQNIHLQGAGGFANDTYWNSTESNATHAGALSFDEGSFFLTSGKSQMYRVRAVRAF